MNIYLDHFLDYQWYFSQCFTDNAAEHHLLFCKSSFIDFLEHCWNPFIWFYMFLNCKIMISNFVATSFSYCHSIACQWFISWIYTWTFIQFIHKTVFMAYGPPPLLAITWTGSSAVVQLAPINSSTFMLSPWLISSSISCKYFHFFIFSDVAVSLESTGTWSLV